MLNSLFGTVRKTTTRLHCYLVLLTLVATFICLTIAILGSPLNTIIALILGYLCDILVYVLIFGVAG